MCFDDPLKGLLTVNVGASSELCAPYQVLEAFRRVDADRECPCFTMISSSLHKPIVLRLLVGVALIGPDGRVFF